VRLSGEMKKLPLFSRPPPKQPSSIGGMIVVDSPTGPVAQSNGFKYYYAV